jgi:hypothetical protein
MERDRLEVKAEAEWAAQKPVSAESAFVRPAAIENRTKEGNRAQKKPAPSAMRGW